MCPAKLSYTIAMGGAKFRADMACSNAPFSYFQLNASIAQMAITFYRLSRSCIGGNYSYAALFNPECSVYTGINRRRIRVPGSLYAAESGSASGSATDQGISHSPLEPIQLESAKFLTSSLSIQAQVFVTIFGEQLPEGARHVARNFFIIVS